MAEPDAQRKIKSEAESSDLGKAEDAGAAEGEYHFSSFFFFLPGNYRCYFCHPYLMRFYC